MNNLKKSTWVLIILVAAIIVLGITLFVTMPEKWKDHFNKRGFSHYGHFLEKKAESSFESEELEKEGHRHYKRFPGRGSYVHGKGHTHKFSLFLILIIGLVVFFIFRKSAHFRKDKSLAILEEQFAEGKISEEEFNRKKTVLQDND